MCEIEVLKPDWPAPAVVRAASTLRMGGISRPPFGSLNLGLHVGDSPDCVNTNRQRLFTQLNLPSKPYWLNQTHGTCVVDVSVLEHSLPDATTIAADAAVTSKSNKVCVVMTADCLPVLFCNRAGNRVAAAHAGWKGLADGVIEATIRALAVHPAELLVWLGPAIGPDAFEVGPEVRSQFIQHDSVASQAFRPGREGRFLADIYQLARIRLQRQGVDAIFGGHWCTFSDSDAFYSYRRDGETGRMASLIWFS